MATQLALLAAAALAALAFRPWDTLRAPALRNPIVGAWLLLSLLWAAQSIAPARLPMQLSGACLLVLMFGWPFAVLALLAVAAASAWLAGGGAPLALELALWNGLIPATLALGFGLAIRRWLPQQLFVFILGRAFIGSALAVCTAGALRLGLQTMAPGADAGMLLAGYWLIGWGEAFLTGALTAIFVAYRPQWLVTYSDARYARPPA